MKKQILNLLQILLGNACMAFAVNTLILDREMDALEETARLVAQSGADAVIIQDLAVMRCFQKICPAIELHASTQMAVHNLDGARMLRDLGFRIEMDDFGSGYSSLNMLSILPIDALKLDMQFIRSAFGERRDTRLLKFVIQLAESLGVPTIAEGVETAEQLSALKDMGCDIVQGYYFSKPLPADEFVRFAAEHS